MKQKEKENTIPKEIYESLTLSKGEIIIKSHSSTAIYTHNYRIMTSEEQEIENKEIDSKEYKIGNYMVKYTLGQGTFGKVKLGVYLPTDEKVAIKILEKNRIIEKDDEIRVKREFDMLSQFNHPNVILVAEIFESEDSFYSVMEYCEGGELFNYIVKKGHLNEDESAYFFFQLINGLEYIHSLGIVHRDLKPENLLLTNDHILKIIDFGLSNYFEENQDPLLSTPCGSPCYASPEMVAGEKYDGFKIDVWSCGIILYAMTCGYLPFEDQDNDVLFKKILDCKLEFPKYTKGLSSTDLIEKILVTDPQKRITIPQIKLHPFYLKGKEIFEEEFSITQVIINPNGKNNDIEKEINDDNTKETIKENDNDKNEPKIIEINIDKENINKENIIQNNENKDSENKPKEEKVEIKDKITEKIEKIENKELKEEKLKEEKLKEELLKEEKLKEEKLKEEKLKEEKLKEEKLKEEKMKEEK